MKKSKGIVAMAAAMLIGNTTAHADLHPGIQGLNDLLIQKGIITKEEVEAQAKKHSMNITGYIQVQGSAIENNDVASDEDGFRIRRAKLAASGYAYEHVKFKVETDLTYPRLDDAYIEDDHLPYLIGRAGQFKVPFSLEMLTSDTEILSIERSVVVNQIAPERDAGVSFSGDLQDGKLFYSVGVFNGHQAKASTEYSVGTYSNSAINSRNDNDQILVAARVMAKPLEGVSVGVSAVASEDPDVDREAYGIEFQAKNAKRGCTLQGEYIWQNGQGKAIDSDGFYIEGGHFIIPKHLEAVVKYEEYNTENDLSTREDDIRWLTVGLNFYIHGNDAKLMANYVFKGEKDDSYDNDTLLAQLQLRF